MRLRVFAVLLVGALAWFIGAALHVPIWYSGDDVGDRTDITVYAMTLAVVVILISDRRNR